MKKCANPDCNETNPDRFSKHKSAKDGMQSLCKKCFHKRYNVARGSVEYICCAYDGCRNRQAIEDYCKKHHRQLEAEAAIDRPPFDVPQETVMIWPASKI